jgi:hypothetical protein
MGDNVGESVELGLLVVGSNVGSGVGLGDMVGFIVGISFTLQSGRWLQQYIPSGLKHFLVWGAWNDMMRNECIKVTWSKKEISFSQWKTTFLATYHSPLSPDGQCLSREQLSIASVTVLPQKFRSPSPSSTTLLSGLPTSSDDESSAVISSVAVVAAAAVGFVLIRASHGVLK